MLFMIWGIVLLAALALYLRQVYSYFGKHGIKHLSPVPVLGNMTGLILKKYHFTKHLDVLYNKFRGERFVGNYEFLKPVVVLRDIELVKKVTVKDFEYFLDHRQLVNETTDPIFGRNLFQLAGQEWKDMRSTLSPAFTSSKIRLMVPFMLEVGDQMLSTLRKKIQESNTDGIDIDVKDLTTRYANDVIASCAFGLKVNSQAEQNNQFYLKGKEATAFKVRQIMMIFLFMSFPKIMRILKISLFSKSTQGFFRTLVLETMKEREEHNVIRPDMIHLLMEAKKGKLTHEDKSSNDTDVGFATVEESAVGKTDINRVWTEDDLCAQAVLFLVAGFDTVSTAMSFLIHELAVNPDIQEKLAQEIKENDEKNGGKFNYNSIQQMPYLDMVISEVLRLWPPALNLDRLCTKDYNLGKANDKSTQDYIVRKGDGLGIPIWAIHRDPEYFPDPQRFDPERFSEENKHKIKPFTYMPFGLGPRNCIGSRFALCEVKVMAYQLLRGLKLSPAAKTKIPAQLSVNSFNPVLDGGHWARIRVRS